MNISKKTPYIIELLTLLGVFIYIAKSIYVAHSAPSIGDEGAYLFKGLMFAQGAYRPFQEYGFWTNKGPLAFLIPGYAQYWFGAGLREGRYFAILISVLMLIGVWITANRLAGKRWAAIAVWVYVLSDAHVATYSLALSQGLVACMMAWMFVCILGESRPFWQLLLGSILSILIVMTRQNMITVPPLVILFIFWQYGWKTGLWTFLAGVVTFIFFHALYWPQIMQLWATWLPSEQTQFLNAFRYVGYSTGTFGAPGRLAQWQAFAIGIYDHFFVLCGFVSAIVLWMRPRQFKIAVFLGVLFASLFAMHMWGSLFNDFCALCFTSYQMFFSITGLLFIVVVFSNETSNSAYRQPGLALCILLFGGILGLYYFPLLGDPLLDLVQLPRLSILREEGQIRFVPLRDVLTYALHVESGLQKRIVSIGAGVAVGFLLFIAGVFLRHIPMRSRVFVHAKHRINNNSIIVATFLIAGIILPPLTRIEDIGTACSTNFLKYYEQAGMRLADVVSPNELVYWKGSGRQLALLLYVEDIRIFPPQITAGGGHLVGDSDHLLRFGLYNEELDLQWKLSADVYLVWKHFPTVHFEEFLDGIVYDQIPFEMQGLSSCEHALYVFRKHQ